MAFKITRLVAVTAYRQIAIITLGNESIVCTWVRCGLACNSRVCEPGKRRNAETARAVIFRHSKWNVTRPPWQFFRCDYMAGNR